MSGFCKLDSGITESSIWSEDLHVRVVFLSFLAKKDDTGFVHGSRSGLIRVCNVTAEQFDDAIIKLSSPDPDSKSKEFEGRRIYKAEGGWIVINSQKYRLPEHEKKEKHAKYMKTWREAHCGNDVNSREFTGDHVNSHPITADHSRSPSASASLSLSLSSSESLTTFKKEESIKDSDIKKEEVQEERAVTWRESFDVYKQMVVDAQAVLLKDAKFFKLMEECHPNISIRLTLEKCIALFWGTDEGWKHKKKSKSKSIDMVSTLKKAAASRHNIVYKPSEFNQNAQDRATIEDKPKYDPKVWQNEYSYSKTVCTFRDAVKKRHPNTWLEMDEPDPQSKLWPEMWEIMISETIPKSEKWERVMKLLSDNGFDNSGLQG